MRRINTQYQIPLGQRLVFSVGEGDLKQTQELVNQPDISLYLADVGEALKIAATKGFVDIVDVILAQPYSKKIPARCRGDAMHFASTNNQYRVLSKLLGANCEEGVTLNGVAQCLMNAALEGHLEIAQLLFEKKKDHITLTHKKSALKIAIKHNSTPLINYLKTKLLTDLNEKEIKALCQEMQTSIQREMEPSNLYLSQYAPAMHQTQRSDTQDSLGQYKKLSASI